MKTMTLCLLLTLLPGLAGGQAAGQEVESYDLGEIAAARRLFEANLQAIRDKDKDAYLACYLQSHGLVRSGPPGFDLGYAGLAATAGAGWPDHIDAADLRLTPVQPGMVYGTYRYRVRYGANEVAGLSERLFVETDQGWKIALTTAFPALPGLPPPPRILVGATLVDGTGRPPVPDAVVMLREGRIECAGPRAACPIPVGVETVNVTGRWIVPGLVDAHVHFSQTGWADGRPDSLDVRDRHPYEELQGELRRHPERFGRSHLCAGVTAVFDVGGYPWTLTLPAWAEPRSDVARVAAAGPLLSALDHWVNLPGERQFLYLADPDVARRGVQYLAAEGADAVKVWLIPTRERPVPALEPLVTLAGEEAARRKLPLIVHATGLAEAKAALRAGAKLLVHSVWDQPVDQEFLDLAKKDGTVYCPTITVGRGYVRMYESAARDQAPVIDDPNGCVDPTTRARLAETPGLDAGFPAEQIAAMDARIAGQERVMAENLKKVAAAGIPIAMGTDAGNPFTLHGPSVYAEMEAMQAAGLSAMDVLVASTRGGALAMGRQADLGTVEKGKLADLLIVGADPAADIKNLRKVLWVVRGGEMRPIAELAALAAGAGQEREQER
ncbi:MAG TPA: amidohydrolase family protein [Thermoanaerobaculia bacterium]|nr:amidohydrolase family protein [Thermoanaerobaculia bacterium]